MTVVAALMAVFFIMQLVGQVPAALWVIFGEDRFHWDATTIGISLAAFGILHSLAQAMITGPVAARLGERRALMLGMALLQIVGGDKLIIPFADGAAHEPIQRPAFSA